ncbi:MAG: MBL fold metallo-hydrolase [Halapricum sp.]
MSEMPFPEPDGTVPSIEPRELRARVESDERVVVLDARNSGDYEAWHIDGPGVESYNAPYFNFLDGVDEEAVASLPEDEEIVVLCAKGGASEYVADRLDDRGFDVVHLEDGMRGWARIYDRAEVTGYDGAGTLYQYHRPSSGCLSYMVVSEGEAAVIDPLAAFTERYREDTADLAADLEYAIDTHVHADHVSGVRDLEAAGITGVVPAPAAERGITYDDAVETIEDSETIDVGAATVEVVHTPGHTTGMRSYLVDGAAILTGDGLFTESVARPDLEAGADGAEDAARQLYESLQEQVLSLGDDVLVGGGHTSDAAEPNEDGTYTATIGQLRAEMPVLEADRATFVQRVVADMPPRPANYEDIIETNLGQRETDEEEALTLELGPNNCAASGDAMTGD